MRHKFVPKTLKEDDYTKVWTVELDVEDECVTLYVTGADSSMWAICSLNGKGALELYRGIHNESGLQIDSEGRIKTVKL